MRHIEDNLIVYTKLKDEVAMNDETRKFFAADSSTNDVYDAVSQISKQLISKLYLKEKDDVILVPILRGGLPMWDSFRMFFSNPRTVFIIAQRNWEEKSVNLIIKDVEESWNGKKIIILDTIIASGITLTNILESLKTKLNESNELYLAACYVSPAAIENIKMNKLFKKIVVWNVAKSMDDKGYLIPYTNGDIGKKMFG